MHIHPMVIHFPIALLIVAFVADAAGFFLKKDFLRNTGLVTLSVAAPFGVIAVITGLVAHDNIARMTSELHEMIETHELMAFITLGAASVALALRIVAERKKDVAGLFGKLSLAALFVAVCFVSAAGYLGGKIVFDYGAGTAIYDQLNQNAPEHGAEHDHGMKPATPGDEEHDHH